MSEGPFIFGMEPPPEVRAELQRHLDKQVMSEQAFHHDVGRLWTELKPDQLVTIKTLLTRIARADEPSAAVAYYTGVISTTLHYKHNVCEACGINHDEDMMAAASPVDKLIAEHGEPFEPVNQAEFDAKHEEYGVRLYTQDDLDKGLVVGPEEQPVICKNCGTLFQSLEDRMLRPPGAENCEGCVQKTKWG